MLNYGRVEFLITPHFKCSFCGAMFVKARRVVDQHDSHEFDIETCPQCGNEIIPEDWIEGEI